MESGVSRSNGATGSDVAQRLRASNRRVAWTLASIAAVFFAGIIATRWVGGGAIGTGVMGVVVLLFLVVAIGRNLRRTKEPVEAGAASHDSAAGADAQRRDGFGAAGEARR
jgi:uncharacterized membrane protein